ncbi:hypothetical protein ACSQ67_015933 [Phaseolus vulgaris]
MGSSPVGTNNPSPVVVSSSFLLSNCAVLSNMHGVVSTSSLDLALVKRRPMSFLNEVSTGKNSNIDSVQLTQATRPIRRLYLENLPASASEKAVMDCFNNLILSGRVNHIQQAQPCISCVLHKDKGQALVEFLTAEDASSALSFDGSTLFGSIVKIRRPKDYVEVAISNPIPRQVLRKNILSNLRILLQLNAPNDCINSTLAENLDHPSVLASLMRYQDLAGQCFRVIVLGCSDNAIYDLMLCLFYRVQHVSAMGYKLFLSFLCHSRFQCLLCSCPWDPDLSSYSISQGLKNWVMLLSENIILD